MTDSKTYSCAVFLLNEESRNVIKLAKNRIKIQKSDQLIAYGSQFFTSTELRRITEKLKKFHAGLLTEGEIKSFNQKLKIPFSLGLPDIVEILNEKAEFKRLRKHEQILAGYEKEQCILHGIENYCCIQEPVGTRKVYAIRLKEEVAGKIKFRKQNPGWDGKTEAFYIGQTGKTRIERYEQHINGIKSNRYVKEFAIQPFEEAECSEYLAELIQKSGINIPIENLSYYQALDCERRITEHLRLLGYGAYSG